MATFKGAVKSLDDNGDRGAKRPSMLGYAYKQRRECGEDGTPGETEVFIVGRDGQCTMSFVMDERCDSVTRVTNKDASADMTEELINALAFATDWDTYPRRDLEAARTGAGTM